MSIEVCQVVLRSQSFWTGMFCLFVLGFNVSLTLFQTYCDGIPACDNLQCCHTGTILSQVFDRIIPPSHIISWHQADQPYFQALTFQCRAFKQGSYLYHLFTTFYMSRLVIEPATFRKPQTNALPLHHLGRSSFNCCPEWVCFTVLFQEMFCTTLCSVCRVIFPGKETTPTTMPNRPQRRGESYGQNLLPRWGGGHLRTVCYSCQILVQVYPFECWVIF